MKYHTTGGLPVMGVSCIQVFFGQNSILYLCNEFKLYRKAKWIYNFRYFQWLWHFVWREVRQIWVLVVFKDPGTEFDLISWVAHTFARDKGAKFFQIYFVLTDQVKNLLGVSHGHGSIHFDATKITSYLMLYLFHNDTFLYQNNSHPWYIKFTFKRDVFIHMKIMRFYNVMHFTFIWLPPVSEVYFLNSWDE